MLTNLDILHKVANQVGKGYRLGMGSGKTFMICHEVAALLEFGIDRIWFALLSRADFPYVGPMLCSVLEHHELKVEQFKYDTIRCDKGIIELTTLGRHLWGVERGSIVFDHDLKERMCESKEATQICAITNMFNSVIRRCSPETYRREYELQPKTPVPLRENLCMQNLHPTYKRDGLRYHDSLLMTPEARFKAEYQCDPLPENDRIRFNANTNQGKRTNNNDR